MDPQSKEAQIVIRFLLLYGEDRRAGRVFGVEHYLSLFPGHESLIRREFEALDWDEGEGLKRQVPGAES